MQLVLPQEKYWNSFQKCIADFRKNPNPFDILITRRTIPESFDTFINQVEKSNPSLQQVPYTELWLTDGDEVVGIFVIRHTLNDNLRQYRGHISFAICPAKRQKGCGTKGLALCLDYAHKELGIENLLISCQSENEASYRLLKKTMIARTGIEEEPFTTKDGTTFKRFWIKTKSRLGKIRPLAVAVIQRGEKVLAIRGYDDVKKEVFYRLVGGGIEFGETGAETLEREFKEELGIQLTNIQPYRTTENIFTFNGHAGHEIVLVYTANLPPQYDTQDIFHCIEEERRSMYAEFINPSTERVYPTGSI